MGGRWPVSDGTGEATSGSYRPACLGSHSRDGGQNRGKTKAVRPIPDGRTNRHQTMRTYPHGATVAGVLVHHRDAADLVECPSVTPFKPIRRLSEYASLADIHEAEQQGHVW